VSARGEALPDVNDLAVVQAEVLDNRIDGVDSAHAIALDFVVRELIANSKAVEDLGRLIERGAEASEKFDSKRLSLAANSAGRLRASSSLLNDATSHCRTLPFKCSSRLPMLFDAS
jgi:hypothetical protein